MFRCQGGDPPSSSSTTTSTTTSFNMKKPSSAAVIDLTDDAVEELFETHSTGSSSDIAIIRTLADNGLTVTLPPTSSVQPQPLPTQPLPITSSPLPAAKNRNSRRNNFTSADEVTVVKTVTLRKKTPTRPAVVIIPSDPPLPPTPSVTERKCPVCFDVIRNPSVTLCGHVYCTECIKAAVGAAKQCPICRKKLTLKGFHPLYL